MAPFTSQLSPHPVPLPSEGGEGRGEGEFGRFLNRQREEVHGARPELCARLAPLNQPTAPPPPPLPPPQGGRVPEGRQRRGFMGWENLQKFGEHRGKNGGGGVLCPPISSAT